MHETKSWETIQLFPFPSAEKVNRRINVVAAVRVLPISPPRYQIHLGRFNGEGAFTVGVSATPGVDLSEAIRDVTKQAQEFIEKARKERA